MITVADALRDTTGRLGRAGSDSPRQEANWLLSHLLGKSSVWLTLHSSETLDAASIHKIQSVTSRRVAGEPLSYIIGDAEFYGRRFWVDNRVLVPRPETEELLELAIGFARRPSATSTPPMSVVDVGTGSGILAVSLALELPTASVIGVDISESSLDVARANVKRHNAEQRVILSRSDLLETVGFPIDLLVANLPYVRSDEISGLQPEVLREPRLALDGGPDGFDLYRRLMSQAAAVVAPTGGMFFEIGYDQGQLARDEASRYFSERDVKILKDLSGRDRFVVITPSS